MNRFLQLTLPGCLLLLLGACTPSLEVRTADDDARLLYQRAHTTLYGANFEQAIKIFQILESRYPFSDYALQAQLDLAYAYLMYSKNEEAISEADRFIRFNPTHQYVDYAYYIKGLANFGQRKRVFGSWFKRDAASFNQPPLLDAFNNFAELLYRFPDSQYAPDARQRMIFLRNIFARHEIIVADFYMKKKAWVAAINRANYVLQYHDETPSNEDALAILVQGYRALELEDAALNAERVLRLNYPNNPLLQTKSKRSIAANND